MDERCIEGKQSFLDSECVKLLREVLHPDNVGRRLAILIAGNDLSNLTKIQRKTLGRGVAILMADVTASDYMKISARTYVDVDGLRKQVSDESQLIDLKP